MSYLTGGVLCVFSWNTTHQVFFLHSFSLARNFSRLQQKLHFRLRTSLYISKIIERVVKSRLTDHLTFNSLLNSHQSAYCKHHSTETALLYIHYHLVSAKGSQKVSCLCLLDLSAAFDTIDHDILTTRLSSWFGIHGSVLSWFKSYLSSRPFCIKCVTDLSFWHTSSCGVAQDSVLGPLLFVM